jgi:PAS domain S-box-containing protein
MNEILDKTFGAAITPTIFFVGAFLSIFGAALAQRMYRAQSLALFAALAVTQALSFVYFLARLVQFSSGAGRLTQASGEPQFTVLFLVAYSLFWLSIALTAPQMNPSSQPVAQKKLRWWLAAMGGAVFIIFGQAVLIVFPAFNFVPGEMVAQIILGAICGIFLVVATICAFRLWRSRHAIWGWLMVAGFANTAASMILYRWAHVPDSNLLIYAGIATTPVFVIFGLFADQSRFVQLESELRRGLLDTTLRLETDTRHLQTILASSREMVVHVDRDERVVHVTPSFVTFSQTTPEKLLSRKLSAVVPSDWMAELAPALQDARRGRTFQADRLLRQGESRRLFQIYATPLQDEKERITGVHLSLLDLAERGRREISLETQIQAATKDLQAFRRIVELSTEAIYLTDERQQIVYANEATERLTGFTRAELVGNPPLLFRAQSAAKATLDEIHRKLTQGKRYRGDLESRRKDGASFISDVTAVPLAATEGQASDAPRAEGRHIWIEHDVTERRRLENALRETMAQAKASAAALTESQRRVNQLSQLVEIGEGPGFHGNLDEIMQRMAQSIAGLGWQRALVFIREAGDFRLSASAGFLRHQRTALSGVQRIAYDKIVIYFDERFRLGRSYFVDSSRLASTAELPHLPKDLKLPSENEWRERDSVLVPIIMSDDIAGLFAVFSPQGGGRPDLRHMQDLEIIADDAAMAIANSRLLKSHRRNEHQARVLADIAETFQSTGAIEQIVAGIAQVAARAFDCNVLLAFREGGDRWLVADGRAGKERTATTNANGSPSALRLADKRLSAWSDELISKKPVVMRKSLSDLPLSDLTLRSREGMASSSKAQSRNAEVDLLISPLFGRGQKIGILAHFAADDNKSFSETDIEFARDLAERAALTYENAQLFFETEKKARELEQANQMVSDFLASTSHELRTPMQAILSMSDFLLRGLPGKLNTEQQRQMEIIQQSGRTLLALINDILDLSKIEAGKMEAAIEEFNLPGVLREIAETIQPLCREKGLRLHVDLARNLPGYVASDPAMLRRVLTNLLGNAVKFTEQGEVRLAASMNRKDSASAPRHTEAIVAERGPHHSSTKEAEQGMLELSVRDTGVGIAAANHKKIFEPFHQIERGAARKHGGSGLGLAIAQKLVGLLGGEIEVNSAIGKGTTFLLRIPVAPVSGAAKTSLKSGRDDGAKRKRKGLLKQTTSRIKGRRRILVVEDNENTRYAMKFLLENEGYAVDFAESGEQALLAAQHQKPHLILLDIMMPAMDGYQVSRMLKSQKQLSHIPVVALTARAMKGDREQALSSGCDDYLTKPFERKDILAVIERWLENGK